MAKKQKVEVVEQVEQQAPERSKLPAPYTCRNCGHEHGTVFGRNPSTDYAGVTRDGRKYTRVDRYRVRCDQCQQPSVVFDYV